ncbi:TSUP family transporter [Onishia taeanensis]
MLPWQYATIFLSLALASYVQTLTGFAFGLIVMGLLAALEVLPIESAALLCTLLALFNNTMALRGHWRDIDLSLLRRLLLFGMVMLPVGYYLAIWLGESRAPLLGMLLGFVILIACIVLMRSPEPRDTRSPDWQFRVAGMLSGLMGGLFAANGPPLVVMLYRQPMTLVAIRCTLLGTFLIMGLARMGFSLVSPGRAGEQLHELLVLGVVGSVVVAGATELARRLPPPLSDLALRRIAYAILLLASLNLIAKGLMA